MGKESKKVERARLLLKSAGDPVLYRGVRWYYFRTMSPWVKRAVVELEKAGKLKRWSDKTKNVVQILD